MEINKPIFSVSDVNAYVKALLTSDEKLKFIYVKGEISNLKVYPSGHIYFSLKDENSVLNMVMFSNYVKSCSFVPKDGDEVVVFGSIDSYIPRGTYNLTVFEMEKSGQGQLLVELEKLKKKLAAEGLFDESRKRKINLYPKAIGIITAINGAAIKDLVSNIKRRYPIADIYVFPSLVQGDQAPKELLKAFNKSQEYDLDTLIIGRGGGASEDLSAFNDEALVRAIAKSKMPVIAAVGHEIDSTLVDFVADKRASTPTGAAELATVDQREIISDLNYASLELEQSLFRKISDLDEKINECYVDLNESINRILEKNEEDLENYSSKLELVNPKNILKRGYSIIQKKGIVINDTTNLNVGDELVITLNSGSLKSEVKEIRSK